MRGIGGLTALAVVAALLALPQAASSRASGAPANDRFANAVVLSGDSGTATGTNQGASKEGGEPTIAGQTGGASVWFAWTPSTSGTASIDTSGSSFDTLLGVYTGSAVNALTLVASNDDASGSVHTSAVTFAATAGTTYRIVVDGYHKATGSVTLNWSLASSSPPPPSSPPPSSPPPSSGPANDNFANAQSLSGASGSVSGSNVGATKESGEPTIAGQTGGASVWYAWTAPAAGSVTVKTAGSSFDTLLGVYTGSSVSALTLVGSNDDASGSDRTSLVTFTATAGTTYRIVADGYHGATGSVALAWTQASSAPPPPPSAPANDNFASAQTVSGASGSASGSNVGATKQSGEPTVAGNAGGASIWYAWTAPAAGSVTVTTSGSSFDTLLGVYTGTAVNALTLVASNDNASSSDHTSSLTFTAVSGTVYRIVVDGYQAATGSVTLTWSQASSSPTPPPPSSGPANDNFANAQSLSGASGSVSGSNAGATKESGEPTIAGQTGGASVWYAWTAPAAGSVTVNTAGSSFDTLLGVYTGTSVSALTLVGSNDDASGSIRTSSVTFTATAGTTYRIVADGYHGATGSLTLAWSQASSSPPPPPPSSGPANDNFASAQSLSGASGTASGSNVGATKESGEPTVAGNGGGASIWYAWTAPGSGTATVNTAGSSFDTLLGVYTGTSVSALALVASNDDVSSGNRTSAVTFTATAGTTYMITVDGYHGPQSGQASGSVTLAWSGPAGSSPPPPPPSSGDPELLAAGDVAYCPNGPAASGAAQTAALIQQFPNDPVALLGDGAYENGSATDYSSCYDPTWGVFKNRTHPAPGYHDYNTPNASGYFGYFGAAAGTAGQGWYSYDLGSWHVVVLNAPLCDTDCSAQLQWLQSDLAAHPSQCTLAYWAYPLFTSGTTDGPDPQMKQFWNVLYAQHVDVVLNGHEHSYERFAPQDPNANADPNGITEFVVGTGGKQEYGWGAPAANSLVRYNTTLGVLKMTLHSGGYDWQYLPTSGSFTDSGSASCH